MEWLILIVMVGGLGLIGWSLALAWPPLAVGYAGLVLCLVALAAYRRMNEEEKRR